MRFRLMRTYTELNTLIQNIEQNGIDVNNEIHGFAFPNAHLSFPGLAIQLCLSGTARIVYDMQEIAIERNNLMIMMPGHCQLLPLLQARHRHLPAGVQKAGLLVTLLARTSIIFQDMARIQIKSELFKKNRPEQPKSLDD